MQTARKAYSRLVTVGRRRMRKAQHGLPLERQLPWLHLLSEQERAEFTAVQRDAIRYEKLGLTNPRRRAEYQAVSDPTEARARTLRRLHTAWNAYNRLAQLGRRRLQRAEQGLPQERSPQWLSRLNEAERAQLEAAKANAVMYDRLGLTNPQRRAEYQAAQDPTGQRAKTLQRLQKAWNAYNRLAQLGRRRLQKAGESHETQQRRASAKPAWLHYLTEGERTEFDAAWADAREYKKLGLLDQQRRDEYRAAAESTGEGSQTFERLLDAHRTYLRLSGRARKRRARGMDPLSPENVPDRDNDGEALGKPEPRVTYSQQIITEVASASSWLFIIRTIIISSMLSLVFRIRLPGRA
jgi:hypothetical protein